MEGLLQLPFYLYPIIKEGLARIKLLTDQHCLIIFASIVLSLLCYIPIVLVLLLLWMYKITITLCLRYKYGKSFVAIMGGIDSICCNIDRCVPKMIMFIEFQGDVHELRDLAVENLKSAMKSKHQKIFYSRGEYMGYHFLYREDVPAEEYVELMASTEEDFLDKEALSRNLEPCDLGLMPLGDRKLFQILICPQPIKLQEHLSNKRIYCVVYRIHHCVGDARSLLHLFVGFLADKDNTTVPNKGILHCYKRRPKLSMSMVKNYLTNVRLKDFPIGIADKNPLRGYNLCEKKHAVWYSDTKSECMDLIRGVKRAFKGAAFLDIMNTCLASSLHDYYVKKGLDVPKTVNSGLVLSTKVASSISYGKQEFELSNKFSVALVRLPINVDADEQLKTRVEELRREYELVRTSIDVQFNYFLGKNFLSLIPTPIGRWLPSLIELTIGVSSLPGYKKTTVYGSTLVDYVMMAPNSPGTGLHIIFSTYDGQLRISMSVDKSVISSYEDSQDIVDGIVRYLRELSNTYCKGDLSKNGTSPTGRGFQQTMLVTNQQ